MTNDDCTTASLPHARRPRGGAGSGAHGGAVPARLRGPRRSLPCSIGVLILAVALATHAGEESPFRSRRTSRSTSLFASRWRWRPSPSRSPVDVAAAVFLAGGGGCADRAHVAHPLQPEPAAGEESFPHIHQQQSLLPKTPRSAGRLALSSWTAPQPSSATQAGTLPAAPGVKPRVGICIRRGRRRSPVPPPEARPRARHRSFSETWRYAQKPVRRCST